MSASSIKRFTLTRRVVASSGIAAALFVAGPVAVAAADDGTRTTSDSSPSSDVSTDAVRAQDAGGDSTADSIASEDGTGPGADVENTIDEAVDNEAVEDETREPTAGGVEPESSSDPSTTPEPAATESPVYDDAIEPIAPPRIPASTHHAATDHDDDSRHDSSDDPLATHAPIPDPLVDDTTPPAFQVTLDAADATAASEHVITASEPIVDVNDEGSVFYQLTHGTGTEGLILFNQSAMMLGVLSRRGRGNGQDYAALLGPGESRFLPARVITEGSLGKHAWDADADAVDLSESTITRFFDRTLVALSTPDEDDPDNRFLDPSDADWAAGWPDGVDATPPPGTSYSVGADGSVTIHNDSDVDIAVISPYHGMWSEQGLAVIRPGQSYTIAETANDPTGFNAYWVQGERQDGRSVVIAQVITAGGQVLVTPAAEGHPDQSRWLPLQGTTPIDTEGIDPGDRFLDPGDYLSPGSNLESSYGNPETAGVTYTVVDDDHVRIHNDGDGTVAVTRSTPGGQLLGFDILAPGESKVYSSVPGGHAIVSVQAERAADGRPVLLGGVGRSLIDGNIVGTPPYDGYPAIPLRDTPLPENHSPTGEVIALPKPADQRERVYTVNGFDIDGDTLTFRIHTPPSRGTLVDNGDGTFTYTPTDPGDLHEGTVNDQFLIQISDGRGGTALAPAFVLYSFENVNEAPVLESVTGEIDDFGGGAWLFVVNDADGDHIGISDFDRPTYGVIQAQQVFEPDPVHGSPVAVPGQYTIVYVPDLVRAHESAYDDEFTVTFDDGHGGTVSETITVHVPFYNQNPYGGAFPTGDSPILDEYGNQVGTITNGPEYALDLDLFDDDGDVVTVSSVTTANGGTAFVRDGHVIYTPKPSTDGLYTTPDPNEWNGVRLTPYYYDTIAITIDDGHGGQSTIVERVLVADTSTLPWVASGEGEVLMVTPGTDEADRLARALEYRTDDSYLALIGDLTKYGLAGTSAADFAEVQRISDETGFSYAQVRMLQDWAANGVDLLGVLLGYESASGLIKQINAFREVQDAAQQRRLASFIAPTMRQIADSNPLIREQFFARTAVTDRLWNLTTELRGGVAASTRVGLRALGPVGTVVGAGLVIHEFATAETPRDYAHASVEAAATALPVIGLVGCAFGPLGCVVGVATFSAVGFGLSGGNAIARAWWDTMDAESSARIGQQSRT